LNWLKLLTKAKLAQSPESRNFISKPIDNWARSIFPFSLRGTDYISRTTARSPTFPNSWASLAAMAASRLRCERTALFENVACAQTK
jgi:hypothetical protein